MKLKKLWEDRNAMESPEEVVFGRFIGKFVRDSIGNEKIEKYYREIGKRIWKGEKVEKGMLILDEGVGPIARFTIPFAESGARVIAIDISKNGLKEAEKRVKEKGLKNVDFLQVDIKNLPFKSDVFDVTFCRATLLHLPDKKEVKIALKEMGRVVNKNGTIYFDAENYSNPVNWPIVLGTRVLQAFKVSRPPHLFYNYFSLVKLVKSAGLDIAGIDTGFSLDTTIFFVPPFSIYFRPKIIRMWGHIGNHLNERANENLFWRSMGFYWYIKAKCKE